MPDIISSNIYWDHIVKSSLEQLCFYNNDHGSDLPAIFHGPSRARFANIAACLVDGKRFLNYLERSSYWETDLITAARIYSTKPESGIWQNQPQSYQQFLGQMRGQLLQSVPRKRIYQSPQRLNFKLDLDSIGQMLKQIWMENEVET